MFKKQNGYINMYKKSDPVSSYGIIAFIDKNFEYNEDTKKNLTSLEEVVCEKEYKNLKVLMIERRNTMGYDGFVRGKYFNNDQEYILKTYLEEMTGEERDKIKNLSFDELWDDLWCNHSCIQFKQDKIKSKAKYSKLDIKKLLDDTETKYNFTEFGFPKGRKNNKENALNCAEREFSEETFYKKTDYTLLDIPPIVENFKGTNNINYKHVYYFAFMNPCISKNIVSINNYKQYEEVSNLEFFSYKDADKIIRQYDTEKKKILKMAFDIVEKYLV